VSVSVESLVEELRVKGHSVQVFTAKFPRHKDSDSNVWRFASVRLPFFPQYPFAVPPFYWALRHFRAQKFDIIHSHTPYTIGFVGLRWAESHGIPIVSTYHTLYERYAHYVPYFPKVYVRYKAAKHTNYYYNRVAHVITPSEAAYTSLRRQSVKTPITIIPTGNPPVREVSREAAREMMGTRTDEKALLYVGRMAREKNITLLLDSVAQVMKNRPDTRLWMVGDGPDRAAAQKHAREIGIGDRVKCVGAVPRGQVDMYYAGSDLFVFASTTETQGLVIGEAMTHGLPSVAVRGGGASDNIADGETGIIVGSSVAQISDAVEHILDSPSLLSTLRDNCLLYSRNWTQAESCARVVDIYNSVLSSADSVKRGDHVYSPAN
jgi:glycosyltransferase involved in cell wall biosynthesis